MKRKHRIAALMRRRTWSLRAEEGLIVNPISYQKMKRIEPTYRWARWSMYVQMGLPLLILALLAVIVQLPRSSLIRQWFFDIFGSMASSIIWGSLLVAIVANGVFSILAHRRLIRRVVRSRCQLCHSCGYNLQGRDRDEIACPECGYQIAHRECVLRWCRLMRGTYIVMKD